MPRTEIGLPFMGPFSTRKRYRASEDRLLQVGAQGGTRVAAQIDHPVLGALAVRDEELSPLALYGIDGETGNLFDPEARAKHEHEHRPVPRFRDDGKEARHLCVFQMAGQRLRKTDRYLGDGIGHRHSFFIDEIIEEQPHRLQVVRDGFRCEMPPLERVHVGPYLLAGDLRKRDGEPCNEVRKDVQVDFHRPGRIVLSLQRSPVAIDTLHRFLLSLSWPWPGSTLLSGSCRSVSRSGGSPRCPDVPKAPGGIRGACRH